jgi:hypothetical protein
MALAICAVVLLCGCTLEGAPVIGPGGGFVFYDKGSYSNDWRYLECAPVDAGEVNTSLNTSSSLLVEEAGKLCADFLYGGYDDWRLPNGQELKILRDAFPAGGKFDRRANYLSSDGTYWIPGEKIRTDSRFSDTIKVRPVRAF